MHDLSRLTDHLQSLGRVLLGYSGGVDSALLAVAARRALPAGDFVAVIGRSASYPEAQHRAALALAAQFDLPVRELETRELEDPNYLENPVNRCYHCKTELWNRLTSLAALLAFDCVIDGTHADDLTEHRPGRAAGLERGVRSPLAELGLRKPAIREMAKRLGIPLWDAPASPCLSSRVQYGLAITPERLRQVERAEEFLRSLGVTGDLRVRHLGVRARIEVAPGEFDRVDRHWADIVSHLSGLGFEAVERDARGYRRGSLLVLA
jgi:pyridinium-3,5-biscarboxylic acid mononucleotide sulfurtransferase